jgi:hypothetical protein
VQGPAPDPDSPKAELVLQNSRLSGARRALRPAVTTVGQAPGCDIRLDVRGVSPLHCLLVQTPAGLLLRDLHTESGTQVNGEHVSECLLRDGDVVSVGPFRFKVRVPLAPVLPDPEAMEREKEALRIQATAVAAQQAALTEEELRLQQRRLALEQQEAQLAAHLEEKRQRLTDLRDQARQARADLRNERTAYEQRVAATAQDLAAARREVAADEQQVQAERRRLVDLRRRLRQRWHRHWAAERAKMRQREEQLAAADRDLEQANERQQHEKAALHQARLRLNGETELSGRHLSAAWAELHRTRDQWQEEWATRQQALEEQARHSYRREIAVATAQHALALEAEQWQKQRLGLQQEMKGLDSRVANQRLKVVDQEREVARLEAIVATLENKARPNTAPLPSPSTGEGVPAPTPVIPDPAGQEWHLREAEESLRERLVALETVAGELADQRHHLAEQCLRLAQTQHDWQEERAVAAAQLEELALRLQEQGRGLAGRELALHALDCGLRQHQEQLTHRQRHLEAWQTRLADRTAAWEAARDRQLADLQAREELSERRLAILTDLRRRWHRCRRQQLERLRAERAACEGLALEYVTLREECQSRLAVLAQEERTVCEWAMAIEEYRKECLGHASDSTSIAGKLEQLRQRWATIALAAESNLAQERRVLQVEAARLQERQRELGQQADRVAIHELELSNRQTAWEQQQIQAEDERCKHQQQVHSLHVHRDRTDRELKEVRDELERVIRVLMDDSEDSLPVGKAA